MPLSCSAMRLIHLSIPLPYGGLHHTNPCQGDVNPSSSIVSARSAGTHVLSKPGEHTSRSKPTPSASNTDLGVYHSTEFPTAASWTNPLMIHPVLRSRTFAAPKLLTIETRAAQNQVPWIGDPRGDKPRPQCHALHALASSQDARFVPCP